MLVAQVTRIRPQLAFLLASLINAILYAFYIGAMPARVVFGLWFIQLFVVLYALIYTIAKREWYFGFMFMILHAIVFYVYFDRLMTMTV